MFEPKSMILVLGSSVLLGAVTANAQLDVDAVGRAAGGVSAAGRAPGEIGAGAHAGAEVDGAVRGVQDAQVGVLVQSQLTQQLGMPGVRADVHNGVATLTGTVATEADKQKAEQIAHRIAGVTRVRNTLFVEGASGRGASSGQRQAHAAGSTEAAIRQSLHADARLAQRDIDVHTRNDVVTLTGDVTSVAEKESAGRIAAQAAAGAEVRNRLVVRSPD